MASILVALGGTAVIAQDGFVGSVAVFGNAMTILATVTFTVYALIGRPQRLAAEPVGVLSYSIVPYTGATLALLPVALLLGTRL